MGFENVTPVVARGQGRPTPLFVCLVGHGKCPIYQTKQKMKKHLLQVHNFVKVEVGVGGRPHGPRSGPQRTTQEQNKRYNIKACSNPLFKVAVLDSKARSRFEVNATARWEKMAEEMKAIKVPRSIPPLAKLFQEHTQEFLGISAYGEGEVQSSTFACFKRNKNAHDIIAASVERYILKLHDSL